MILKGNKVKLQDGKVIEANWSTYQFTDKQGKTYLASYTDAEVEKMKLEHPEIKWS